MKLISSRTMARRAAAFAAAAILLVAGAGSAVAEPEPARFALLVGANLGEPGEPILRHAEDDATRLAQTLRLLGEFPADQVVLMTGATASEMRESIIRLNARVREHAHGILVVFYSGHADESSLHLAGTRLPMTELKALLVGSPAVSRLLIVDACRSGSLIQLKGAHPAPAFVVPAFMEPVPEGFAVLTSSAASEDSQESAALGGSYFSYYVNSGLIGAADQDRNQAVTLSELYAFASSETRAATAASRAGPQNPTFQFALGGRHDLVLTRLGRRDVRLGTLRFGQPGRYLIQQRGVAGLSPPVAELAAREAGAELALVPGPYRVTLRGDRDISERDVVVAGGEVTQVELAQMVRIDVGRTVRKGGPLRSATGFTVALGWHGGEIGGSTLVLGAGPNFVASLRHDRKWFSVEGRLGLDRGAYTDGHGVQFDNRGVTPSVLALVPIDWKAVTLGLGAEVGVVLMHQSLELTDQHTTLVTTPAAPSALRPEWSRGLELGPVAQLDAPLGANTYLRFEGGILWRAFNAPDGITGDGFTVATDAHSVHWAGSVRFLAGLGTAF